MEEEKFDFEAYKKEAVRKLLNKEPGTSIDKLMKPLMKQILEAALEVRQRLFIQLCQNLTLIAGDCGSSPQ
jgi:hypothetical protein